MKLQNELSIYDENINKALSKRLEYKNDNLSSDTKIQILISSTINLLINYILSEKSDKNKINNIIIYDISDMNYYLLTIVLILINIFKILTISIERKLSKNKIRVDRSKEKKKNKIKIDYFDIKKDSNKINKIKNMIYIGVFIIKFLIIIGFINQTKSNNIIFCNSKITLKIKGEGKSKILGKYEIIDYLEEIYINKIQTNISTNNKYYFKEKENIVELILNDNINTCEDMFLECINITEINLSNFHTSQVTEMNYMFGSCSSLTSLDLSNFNTSKVINMANMFESCSSLTSLDLSSFDTSQVSVIDKMFYSCSSLTSLDLSNFNTSNVIDMSYMFYSCLSLTSLNLSNFNTSQVTNIEYMFYNCSNLEYINLNNLDESKLNGYKNMFSNVPVNIVICIGEKLTQNKNLIELNHLNCKVVNCSNNWKLIQKKIVNNNECIENCNKHSIFKFEYNGKCLENCKNGFLYDDNRIITEQCKCELDKCLLCPNVALKKNLCTKCNINYYPKENDPLNIGEYINCYNQSEEGYYLDNNTIYKKCYHTCKSCNIKGNDFTHNCIECNDNLFNVTINNFLNCYEKCNYYYYFDHENNLHCTMNLSCPEEYPKLIETTKECIKVDYNNENTTINSLNNEIYEIIYTSINLLNSETNKNIDTTINSLNYETNKNIDTTINSLNYETNKNIDTTINSLNYNEEIDYYNYILKKIEGDFTSENYDTTHLDNGKDDIITNGKITTTLTTIKNQKNNINNNVTRIDLGECETLLRNFYNISINESLYIKKIDIIQDGMKTLKVEYNVYAKLFGKNLIKLNLTVCKKNKISILIPFVINDNLDKFNISSGYYNDICYITTSEDGTDILLKDRQKEYIDKDKIACQEDCDFSEYNYDTFIVKCSCEIKECSESFADMNINKQKLLENFINIKSIINFNFLKCYKKLFNKLGIINNIGCYIIFSIILFHIITIFVFTGKQFNSLKKKLKKIIALKENESNNTNLISKIHRLNTKKKSLNKYNIKKYSKKIMFNIKNALNESRIKINLKKIKNNKDKKENIKKYIDEEINGASYKFAILFDKRNYCQYYISLLKTQHNLISALFNNNDYNCGIIKINLFFIGFTIEYTINALFYNDDTMHKIYESKGDFDLNEQLPIIFYSTIISMILNYPLNFLALTNDTFINIKQNKSKINILKKSKKLIKTITIKFVLYFIVSFLFLLFFWFYISMFGVIYKNTQKHLLKDTLLSFELSLIIPFIIYLFPGIFRIPALSNSNKKRVCLYNFSKFLQSF